MAERICFNADSGILNAGDFDSVVHIFPADARIEFTRNGVLDGVFHGNGTGDSLGFTSRILIAGGGDGIGENTCQRRSSLDFVVGCIGETLGKSRNCIGQGRIGIGEFDFCQIGSQTNSLCRVICSCEHHDVVHDEGVNDMFGGTVGCLVAGSFNGDVVGAGCGGRTGNRTCAVREAVRKVAHACGERTGLYSVCETDVSSRADRLFGSARSQLDGIVHDYFNDLGSLCGAFTDLSDDSHGVGGIVFGCDGGVSNGIVTVPFVGNCAVCAVNGCGKRGAAALTDRIPRGGDGDVGCCHLRVVHVHGHGAVGHGCAFSYCVGHSQIINGGVGRIDGDGTRREIKSYHVRAV